MINIIAGTQSQQLNRLIDREPFKSQIHGALREVIGKVYGYRGNTAAHGQVGESTVGIEEAEWVLVMCASTMVYIVRKLG